MADDEHDQNDKTEAPSQRRLQRARDEGQVPISRELVTLASLVAGLIGLMMLGSSLTRNVVVQLALILGNLDSVILARGAGLRVASHAALLISPVIVLPTIFGAVTVLVQSGLVPRWNALQPKLGNLNPAAGARRTFSRDTLIEAAKSILKLCLIAAIFWNLRHSFNPVAQLALQNLRSVPPALSRLVHLTAVSVLIFQACVAAFDLFWVRMRHTSKLRMSKHDLREEMKESDGDPRIKARIRQLRMQRAKRRMLAQVPKATVVITNPTHYAVALTYDKTRNATPRVVAKGADDVAARIRKAAEENGVPIVSNPPLARALYRLELDAEILPEQYQTVAEIIAYVWKLRSRVRRGP